MDEYDESRDLFWYALNYRGAQTPAAAEAAWQELKACVQLLIADACEKERDERPS